MKKKDVISLWQGLNNCSALKGARFTYAIARNLAEIKADIEALQKSVDPSKEFSAYENKRIELNKKYSKKDEKGESITENGKYILEDQEKFDEEFNKLKEENQSIVDARDAQIKEYMDSLDDEIEVKLWKIKETDLPEDITVNQTYAIFPILEE